MRDERRRRLNDGGAHLPRRGWPRWRRFVYRWDAHGVHVRDAGFVERECGRGGGVVRADGGERDISIALTAVSLGLLDGIAKDLPRRAE